MAAEFWINGVGQNMLAGIPGDEANPAFLTNAYILDFLTHDPNARASFDRLYPTMTADEQTGWMKSSRWLKTAWSLTASRLRIAFSTGSTRAVYTEGAVGCRAHSEADMSNMVPEGPALQSKKFLAFLVASVLWKVLAVILILFGNDITFQWTLLLAIILVAGFVETGYIIGQASLDKYVRLAHIAAQAGQPSDKPKKTKPAADSEEQS